MKLGLVCHSTLGGSGVIAAELGEQLGARGHDVCFIGADAPPRLRTAKLHRVETPVHALFPGGEYALALASKLAEVGHGLDVLHVHYAIPHATSAHLARQLLGAKAPKLVVTLHGTDVLTLGADPALHPVVKLGVQSADAVTTPTRYLATEAKRVFGVEPRVIGNFVDTARFVPLSSSRPGLKLVHDSNFRPLKRVGDVVRIYAEVKKQLPGATLTLVGDGPARPDVERLAAELRVPVTFAGEQRDVVPLLQAADVFLFPSETESFGLAALEALSCGVPVVASRTGGLPELVEDGVTGALLPVGDVAGMAARTVALLTDPALHARHAAAARATAEQKWRPGPQVDAYEALYRSLV
ncbi:MAG: N-acetyl-alpha-D-glucosaminyl L-malate synthase BshA [Myxococcaceae bacterium]|nr:N-acetyl-alpha-D-glucosaminyl L-malate synthase BshA [Myxococcaceae bacterium]